MILDIADALTAWINQRQWAPPIVASRQCVPRHARIDNPDLTTVLVVPRHRTAEQTTRGRLHEKTFGVDVLLLRGCLEGSDTDGDQAAPFVVFGETVADAIGALGLLTTAGGTNVVLDSVAYGDEGEGLFDRDMLEMHGLMVATVFTKWKAVLP